MTIGKRIKELRTGMGINQVDFAKKIGVSKQTLYKYENDIITNIPSDKIELIAEKTNTTPAYIMGWMSDEEIGEAFHNNMNDSIAFEDSDLAIIQRERSKMSNKERTKLMNILKANFDEYNWEEDDSGNID